MRNKLKDKKWWIAAPVILALAVGAIMINNNSTAASNGTELEEPITASGVIQAQQALISSEFGGRITDIYIDDTENVTDGQVLVQLDTATVDAQIEMAQAYVDMAEAGLAQAKAGASEVDIRVAEAQLAQVDAGVLAAQQAVSDTMMLMDNPQDIDLQIAVARAQLESAEHQYLQAVALKDAIELVKAPVDAAYAEFDGGGLHRFEASRGTKDDLELPAEIKDLLPEIPDELNGEYEYEDWELHINDGEYVLYKWVNITFPMEAASLSTVWWQSWIGVNAADATREGMESQLNYLYVQRADSQIYQQTYVEALNALAQLEAQRTLAQVQVDGLKQGATSEQIAVIEAQVAQAYSGLDALNSRRDMFALTAPFDGTVVDILMVPGEVAAQGAPVVKMVDLEDLTLTVYVPENRLGQVQLNQTVDITVNSFPGRTFTGYVIHIADQAEFTPRNVATQEERVNLVFAVQIRVVNEDGVLKPGMPADVIFGE